MPFPPQILTTTTTTTTTKQLECKVDCEESTKIHQNALIFGKIFEHEVEAPKRKGSHVIWDKVCCCGGDGDGGGDGGGVWCYLV